MNTFNEFDRRMMTRALELAARGLETTDPNPRVGCVLVIGDRVVGEGWHERAGGPHAEVRAIEAAAEKARGATAYITLEPCNHHGRTPPCVDALLAAQVNDVVYALEDPNPAVNGSGAARLRESGMRVRAGLCADEAAALNPGFVRRMQTGRPWVRLKTAATLDGRTALVNGESRWITGEAARADVHALRARSSAVSTGVGTVIADDPQLNVRRQQEVVREPARIVFDTNLRTPLSARVLDAPGTYIFTAAESASAQTAAAFESRGAIVEILPSREGRVDLEAALLRMGELEINELLVEGGPTLTAALLASGLVDEWIHYIAPKLLGPGKPLAAVAPLARLADASAFEIADAHKLGDDLKLTLRMRD